jgi:hypothetical protein
MGMAMTETQDFSDDRAVLRLALLAAAALAGCARVGLPTPAMPGSGNKGMAEMVEDRVWIDTDPDAPLGTLRAFLSDGTLVMTSCVETWRLAPWRWVEEATLVWEEDGRNLRGEVAMAGRDQMALVIDPGGANLSRSFRAARAPVICPDLAK